MPGRVGWGFIGASTISREWMLEAVRRTPGNEVVAVFSRSRQRGERFAAETGIGKVYDRLADLLAAPDIQAIYVASTNERHHSEVLACAAAGKHVLCEKPLALSVEDGLAMVAACERAKVVLAVNHHLRGAAPHRAMREIIASGRLGRIVVVRTAHGALLPEHLQTWRIRDAATGAGAALDLTVHDADIVRFLLDDEIVAVQAMTANSGLAAGSIEDTALAILRTRGGVLVHVQDVFNTPFNRTAAEIHGTKGSLFALDCMTQEPIGSVVLRNAGGETPIELVHENRYARVVRQFNEAIAGHGRPDCTGRDGVASLAVALAVLESARTGCEAKVDSRTFAPT
ncbi:MAG: Gfo/Idh/MocA family oxidoreductase [Methylobacteriaceae bacterium]|nr:Gfo/Idh/MocA family oxidoreductase [Methylobacteriaceae bacterium]